MERLKWECAPWAMCRLTIAMATLQKPARQGRFSSGRPRIRAKARFSPDFSELKVSNDEHEAKASGSVGNASSHIVLNNEHDGIEIRKAGVEQADQKKKAFPAESLTECQVQGIPSPARRCPNRKNRTHRELKRL